MAKPYPKRRNPRFQDLTGRTFGQLTVLCWLGRKGWPPHHWWECVCTCGTVVEKHSPGLLGGKSRSCGCLSKPHGGSYSLTYASWNAMVMRCTSPKNIAWQNYGGRGIKICQALRQYAGFVAVLGERASADMTLDRVNSDANYSCGKCGDCIANNWPLNCRWADKRQQATNRRSTRFITYNGESLSAAEWGRRFGIGTQIIAARLRNGWTTEAALTTPVTNQQFVSGKFKGGQFFQPRRYLAFDGQTLTLTEWARKYQLPISTLHCRLKANWPIARAITTSPRYSKKIRVPS